MNAWKSGGDSTKEAAAKAPIGTDAQIHTFLTSELDPWSKRTAGWPF
ncbi:ALF repeat-containing protein [Streptomyces anulatus]